MMPRTQDDWMNYVANELREGDRRMDTMTEDMATIKTEQAAIRIELAAAKRSTDEVAANTKEMLGVFESWRGAMRTLEMIGKLAKPVGYILGMLASVAALYTALKSGAGTK